MDGIADQTGAKVRVKKLGPNAGAKIHGVNAADPLDDETRQVIYDALMENGVIVFSDQDITREQQAAFAANFGELTVHPFSPHLEEMPEMIVLDNDGDHPPLSTDVWHSDETFRLEPPMGTLLRAAIVPPVGGDTLFASMTAAFEGLSDQMQNFVSGLEAVHDFKNFKRLYGSSPEHRQKLWDMMDKFPNPVHPVVRTHPMTGQNALFVSPQFTLSIKGMKPDESDALLQMLYAQANVPEYQFRVHWKVNKMVFWDNRLVMHYAARDYLPARRRMERVTLKGDLPYGPPGKSYYVYDVGVDEKGLRVENYQASSSDRAV
jgi:taurine dioxygenase